jgi:SAM-dependent methyltransferase
MDDTPPSTSEAELDELFRTIRQKMDALLHETGLRYTGIEDGTPAAMPSRLMTACCALADRVQIFEQLPKGGVVAEIGNFFGDFSVKIIETVAPSEFHTFDFNLHTIRPENRVLLEAHGSVVFHEGDPAINFFPFPDNKFDIVYLNKSKDYAGVWNELTESLRMLKPDGYIVCNDYTAWDPIQCIPYGVLPAVTEFAIQNNLDVPYISLQARGFLNIALRRLTESSAK